MCLFLFVFLVAGRMLPVETFTFAESGMTDMLSP